MQSHSLKSAALAACALLAACGGGGGSVGSTPPPPPAPTPSPSPSPSPSPTPTPTPTPHPSLSIDLPANHSFAASSTMTDVGFRTTDGVAETTQGDRQPLTLSYDEASGSYTVVGGGRRQAFGPADRLPDRIAGEARYATSNESGLTDFLTLAVLSYTTGTPNSYVGMGYWQHNRPGAAGTQNTNFQTFTYGLDTPAASVPRSGFASWDTDIFGLYTRPGERTRTMEGFGRFDVDFANGAFITSGKISEFDVVGSGGATTLELDGGGSITSDGRFSGIISYSGASGSLMGGFYGPAAQEMGASFLAVNNVGSVLNGAMTGRRNSQTLPSANITLLNLQVDQVLQGPYAGQIIPIGTAPSGTPVSGNWSTPVGGVHVTAGKPSSIEMLIGGIDNLTRAASQPRANFDRYVGQSPTVAPVTVDFYRPGANNSELALTYASFATWRWTTYDAPGGGAPTINDSTFYVVYGLSPPGSFINALTGTASYQGVVYGVGSTREGARYDLGGRSAFLVDFSAGRYSGSLQVNGVDAAGSNRDFGSYDFASTLNGGGLDYAVLQPHPTWSQAIRPTFYGPQGQEIGANFNLLMGEPGAPGTVYLDGITVAKKQ